jgi:hypothetical protein
MRPATIPTCLHLEVSRSGAISAAAVAVGTIETINGLSAATAWAQEAFVVLHVTEAASRLRREPTSHLRRTRTSSCDRCSRRRWRSWLPARPPSPGSAKPPAWPPRRHAMQQGPSHQLGAAPGRLGKLLAKLACVLVSVQVRARACRHDAPVRAVREAAVANRSGVGLCCRLSALRSKIAYAVAS